MRDIATKSALVDNFYRKPVKITSQMITDTGHLDELSIDLDNCSIFFVVFNWNRCILGH